MPKTRELPMRLALRAEGTMWNAYCAPTDTMNDAIFLGSIRLNLVVNHPKRRKQFMDLMTDVMGDAIKEAVGVRPDFHTVRDAPEHERGGNG